jgi:hypothetical protein
MAGQKYDVTYVIKQKYLDTVNPEHRAYVYNLLNVEEDCQDLVSLLKQLVRKVVEEILEVHIRY